MTSSGRPPSPDTQSLLCDESESLFPSAPGSRPSDGTAGPGPDHLTEGARERVAEAQERAVLEALLPLLKQVEESSWAAAAARAGAAAGASGRIDGGLGAQGAMGWGGDPHANGGDDGAGAHRECLARSACFSYSPLRMR